MILNFNVNQQTIVLMKTSSVPRIGSKEYLALQFSFSSDWENLEKLVYLQSGDVSQPISIVDNLVEVPEWFTEQDSFNVTLFGTDGTTEVPTNVVSVQLEKSNELWQKDAPEPQPSWLVVVLESVEKAKASEDAAKLSEINAANSANSAQESAESASASALSASASATVATQSETSAIEAKTSAETAKTEAIKSANAAKESETASKASETAAAESATVAKSAQSGAEAAKSAAAKSAKQAAESAAVYDNVVSDVNQLKQDVEHLAPTIVCKSSGNAIALDDSSNRPLSGLNLYGKTTQNGTPSPDSPVPLVSVGDGGSVVTTVCSKNLFADGKVYRGGLNNSYGEIYTKSPVESPVHSIAWAGVGIRVAVSPNNTYTVSSDITPCKYFTVTFYKEFDSAGSKKNAISFKEFTNRNTATFTTPENCYCVVITSVSNVESDFTWSWWQVEHGSVATVYEPYEGQTLSISTPNGLPGIPVSSGGNYTDSTGQQWICDEVDFARGVRIVRLKRKRVSPDFNWLYSSATNRFFAVDKDYKSGDFTSKIPNVICTHFKAAKGNNDKIISYINDSSNGYAYKYSDLNGDISAWKAFLANNEVYIIGELDSAIEIPLTTDEIAAYDALHTYKPNTTIYNDADAQMEVNYQADTKLYIDKQFEELKSAIISLGGNV